jgi:Uma2 family endonuclease
MEMVSARTAPETAKESAERWTYERYLRETAEGEYFAVIGGQRLMAPSPNRLHQVVLINLAGRLKEFARQNHIGTVMIAPFDVRFSDDEFVQPDLLLVAKEHAERLTDSGVMGAPDLVVEIVSPGSVRADRLTKRALYAKHNVPEYWIISPTEYTVEILSLEEGQYELAGLYENEETLASPLLAGLSIKVNTLLEE